MSLSLPEKCLRGFDECRPYSQIASNIGEPEQQSFYCCGNNNGMLSTIPGDIYTLCFKGEFRDQISFNNRRDLVDNSFVIMGALAHIELDEIEGQEKAKEQFNSRELISSMLSGSISVFNDGERIRKTVTLKYVLGLIFILGLANNMKMKSVQDIVFPRSVDWELLDQQASKLTVSEAEIFVDGEESEVRQITDRHGLHDLHDILNNIFDGELHDVFFVFPY